MAGRTPGQKTAYIMDALTTSKRPLGAYEIIAAIRPRAAIAPPTVYRALKRLISKGRVHRIESLNAFVACRHEDCAGPSHEDGKGVAFIICDECGAVDEFVDPVIVERLAAALSQRGFLTRALTLEIRGLCGSCSEKGAAQ